MEAPETGPEIDVWKAAANGDLEKLKTFSSEELIRKDESGRVPSSFAIESGHTAALLSLLQNGDCLVSLQHLWEQDWAEVGDPEFANIVLYCVRYDAKRCFEWIVENHFEACLVESASPKEVDMGGTGLSPPLTSPLFYAAYLGRLSMIQQMYAKDKAVLKTATSDLGATIAHFSAHAGHVDVLSFFCEIDKHEDGLFWTKAKNGALPIHDANFGGCLECVDLLWQTFGVEMFNVLTNEGFSIVSYACCGSYLDLVKYLWTKVPHLFGVKSDDGTSVLNTSCLYGQLDIVKFLQARVPELFNVDMENNVSALHAVTNGHIDVAEYLWEHWPKMFHAKNKEGSYCVHQAAIQTRLELLKFLWEKIPDQFRTENTAGYNVAHEAALAGDLACFKFVYSKVPEMFAKRASNGLPPARDAAYSNSVDILEFLALKKPSLLEEQFEDGGTILTTAASLGNVESVEFCWTHFPDLFKLPKEDKTFAAHIAANCASLSVLKFMWSACPDRLSDLTGNEGKNIAHCLCGYYTCRKECLDFVHEKLPKLFSAKDKDGATVVHYAARNAVATLEYLWEKLKDTPDRELFSAKATSGEELTPLMECVTHGVECQKFFAEKIPDSVNVRAKNGKTVVMLAAESGQLQMLEYFAEIVPELFKAADDGGDTAVQYAAAKGQLACLSFMHDTFPELFQSVGKSGSAVHAAFAAGHLHALEFIFSACPNVFDLPDLEGLKLIDIAFKTRNIRCQEFLAGVVPEQFPQATLIRRVCRNSELLEGLILRFVLKHPPNIGEALKILSNSPRVKFSRLLFKGGFLPPDVFQDCSNDVILSFVRTCADRILSLGGCRSIPPWQTRHIISFIGSFAEFPEAVGFFNSVNLTDLDGLSDDAVCKELVDALARLKSPVELVFADRSLEEGRQQVLMDLARGSELELVIRCESAS